MSAAFRGIVRFEIGYYLRRISTWVYFAMFFGFGFLMVHLAGGAWDEVQIALGGSGGNVHVNSPYAVTGLITILSVFGVLVTAALAGNAVYRDFEWGTHPLFFTTPVSRAAFLGGRFTGALLTNAVIFASIPLGILVATWMPYLDAERFGPFRLDTYVQPFLLIVLPNVVFTGAIFFALAALTRKMLPNYVGGAFLLVGYLIGSHYLSEMDNQRLAAFLDPFGFGAFEVLSKYWTPAERNTRLIPLDGLVLANRAVWVTLGLAILAVAFARFRFHHHAPERPARMRRKLAVPVQVAPKAPRRGPIPVATQHHGLRAQLQQFRSVVRRSFWGIVGNRYYFAIVGAGILFMVAMADQVNKMYGTTTWPVTYAVLDVLGGTFWLFMVIVITFYAGELIWAEREVRIDQVVDATPVRNWVPLAGKWTALALMLATLQVCVMLTGMATQAVKGYYNFEPGLYLRSLGLGLIGFLLLSVLVVLIHVLVNHKYVGHLIVVAFLVFNSFMGEMGLEHKLYRFNSGGVGLYSDMNGFGPYLEPFAWFKGYWAAWALALAVLSNLFWIRGRETGARWRVHLARLRFTRPALSAALLASVLILGLGGFVFYNTNVVNEYRTGYQDELAQVDYERQFKRFQGIAQPRVVGVDVQVDLYPERADVAVRGRYRLRNKTAQAVDSVHVLLPREVEVRRLALSRPAEQVHFAEEHGYRIFDLAAPLQPGDSMALEFEIAMETEGFSNDAAPTAVVENGSFLHSFHFPSLGYDPDRELRDDETRRKHGLAPRPRMAAMDDPVARRDPYISRDADWIDFAATVSTSADQTALAPGYLQREWTENGRRYFRYEMDAPILNFYAFLSARYQVQRDRWTDPATGQDVAIEVYHHPGHEYNLDRMIEGVKKSLDYFTSQYGPYQHRQVRILEFPRYRAFAQAFPNTIPFSEAIGFIARVEDPAEDIDYPFYVTAHEVAHQWWAHQVIGGNVQGATLTSETMAQYSAMMVMEKEYGRDQLRRFLRYEMDRYLEGRAFERKREVPLLMVENQPYIHYRKGAVAMYALRDAIGEERLNGALRSYLEAVRFQEPPYTNAREFYSHLQAATPDSLRYVLEDLFEHITLYDNRVTEATSTPTADGKHRVTLKLEARKLRADSVGNEVEAPMNDWVYVGVFGPAPKGAKLGEPLYLKKHRIRGGAQTVQVTVDREPARVGVDPYHVMIDRNGDDNTKAVDREGG